MKKPILRLKRLSLVLLLGVWPGYLSAQQATDFFQQNCMSCHTIGGGRLTGPDLKDVSQRKERAWIEHFLLNPSAVINSGDPYALQLQQDARGVVMPTIAGMTPDVAKALLYLIEEESKLPKSRFAGLTISDRPFTASDVSAGLEIFEGTQKLIRGGPSCISCHTLGTLRGMGGGRLGPDLTLVYERLGGRKAAGAWLTAPATSTMQSVFRQYPLQAEEILPLLAVFEESVRVAQPANSGALLNFFLAGFFGVCLALPLMGWIWRGRFRNVRRSLVQSARGEQ